MRFLKLLFIIFLYCLPYIILFLILREIYYFIKVRLIDRLEYTREFGTDNVFEEDMVEIIETIVNPTFLPVFFVDVESYIHANLRLEGRDISDGMQLVMSRFHIPPFTKLTRTYKVKCAHRGYYTMNNATVLSKSILIERTKNFKFEAELYVYPKLLDEMPKTLPRGNVFGDCPTPRRIVYDPFSVAGVRDYVPGDPFSLINFKATAKSSYSVIPNIKVNKFDYCSDRILMIYLNLFQPDETMAYSEYSELMEFAFSAAATLVHESLLNGYKVGFAANCRMVNGNQSLSLPIMSGVQHIDELLREMAKAEINVGGSFAALLDSCADDNITDAEIYILTSYVDETLDDKITKLKRKNTVTVIDL